MPTEYLLRLALAVMIALIILLLRQVRIYRRRRRLLDDVIELNLTTHAKLVRAIAETEDHNRNVAAYRLSREDDGK